MYESIINGVWWIPGKDRFMPDSHIYVVGLPELHDYTLIDCGIMDMGSYKLEQLNLIGLNFKDIKRVILTHTHIDHIGCLPEFLKAMPHLEVWVHEQEAGALEKGDESIIYGSSMFESAVRSQYTIPGGFL